MATIAKKKPAKADLLKGIDSFFDIKGKRLYAKRGVKEGNLNHYVGKKVNDLWRHYDYRVIEEHEKAWKTYRKSILRKIIAAKYRIVRNMIFVPYAERNQVSKEMNSCIAEMVKCFRYKKLWCDAHLWVDHKYNAVRCSAVDSIAVKQDPAAIQYFNMGYVVQLIIPQN